MIQWEKDLLYGGKKNDKTLKSELSLSPGHVTCKLSGWLGQFSFPSLFLYL